MMLAIKKEGENITTFTKFDDAEDRGEISHFIIQLELLKQDLIRL